MNLRDGVLDVRLKVSELRARLFSDTEIIQELNTSAQILCNEAQSLQGFFTFNTKQIGGSGEFADNWAQEYTLPLSIDSITQAAYLSGTLFPLQPVDEGSVQVGSYVGGIPFYIYIKAMTNQLTPQVNSGGIIELPVDSQVVGADARTTIGLWPIPQSSLPIYIWALLWHPQMTKAFDIVQIPPRFKLAWTSYAIARMFEKIQNYDKAQYWDGIHEREKEKYIQFMIDSRQEIGNLQYNTGPELANFLRGANTVLVVTNNPTMSNI